MKAPYTTYIRDDDNLLTPGLAWYNPQNLPHEGDLVVIELGTKDHGVEYRIGKLDSLECDWKWLG